MSVLPAGGLRARSMIGRSCPRSTAVRADAKLFAAVYEQEHQALYRYIRSILRDAGEAEDVLQGVMLKALTALQSEERDFELRPWLFRIAHNEAISRIRSQRPTVELDGSQPSPTGSIADAVADRERLQQLWADLTELPERQRQTLVLRELNGLSHEEIGDVIGSTARAVKQTIFEARVALGEFAEGRATLCAEIQRTLSHGDGRVRRGRRMRAHLRGCGRCRGFDAALSNRPQELAALAPVLPAAAGLSLLGHLLPGTKVASAAGGSTAAGTGAVAGIGAAGTGITGALATKVAVIAVAGAAAAGTVGVVHHPVATVSQPQATQTSRPGVSSSGRAEAALRSNAGTTSASAAATSAAVPHVATVSPGRHAGQPSRRPGAASAAGRSGAGNGPSSSAAAPQATHAQAPRSPAGTNAVESRPDGAKPTGTAPTARPAGAGSSVGRPSTTPAPSTTAIPSAGVGHAEPPTTQPSAAIPTTSTPASSHPAGPATTPLAPAAPPSGPASGSSGHASPAPGSATSSGTPGADATPSPGHP